ncbi:hypothetical protein C7T94_16800 [Pedobacter yulinensis]|uniref:Uncharacterized protein n=1 Tax=Pedobacter yulinensis TaxID=2126353 RepID=A0A2T3HHE2_9SPHI|nr:hypothetical protein [Pedobacter yulinensis]PST81859.1 hypothetical protein C7T94_16800 [Pedobacter yulinensis]
MQDKDFDNLFKDRFEHATVEPSGDLWANISQDLEPKKRRFSLVYWSAAAVLLLGVGIAFLYQPEENKRLTAARTPDTGNKTVQQVAEPKTAEPVPARPQTETNVPALAVVQPPAETGKRKRVSPAQPEREPAKEQVVRHVKPETMIATADKPRETATQTDLPQQTEIAIASAEPKPVKNDGFRTQAAFPQAGQEDSTEDEPRERSGRRERGILAFVGKVKDKFDKTTKNIITEKNGTMSIDLGFVRIDKEIN